MAAVTVSLPALLAAIVGTREVAVAAATAGEALAQLTRQYPALDVHLFDESGQLREHVLCFHNEENTRWSDDGLGRPLYPGDVVTILQAVSGG